MADLQYIALKIYMNIHELYCACKQQKYMLIQQLLANAQWKPGIYIKTKKK